MHEEDLHRAQAPQRRNERANGSARLPIEASAVDRLLEASLEAFGAYWRLLESMKTAWESKRKANTSRSAQAEDDTRAVENNTRLELTQA